MEDLYQVSSYGRIKSLPRELFIVNPRSGITHSYWTKEKIRKIKVHSHLNSVVGKVYFECTIALSLSRGAKTFLIHRLVYQAFIDDIDFNNDELNVTHKDGNGLNNHFTNLEAKSRGELLKRSYRLKRHVSPFAIKTKMEIKKISQRAAITRQKKVVQYSLEGNRLHVFNSIQSAQHHTGIANLIGELKGRSLTCGGFVWRYYPAPKKIALAHILRRKSNKMAKQQKAVRQYSPAGKVIGTYKSIAEATVRSHTPASSISNCLAGRVKTAGGYKWKFRGSY